MLKSYLKLALRNLSRTRLFSMINIFGLAAGLTCAILILLYIDHELNVDRMFSNSNRIYRINSEWKDPAMGMPFTTLSPLGSTLVEEYPEVVENSVCYTLIAAQLTIEGKDNYRENMMVVDSTFFRLFDFEFLHGNSAEALTQPNSVVISESMAQKYFGTSDVLNRTINFHLWQGNARRDYQISGVLKEYPYNSITYLDEDYYGLIVPMQNVGDFFAPNFATNWDNHYAINFVLLTEGSSPDALAQQFPTVLKKPASEEVQKNLAPKL